MADTRVIVTAEDRTKAAFQSLGRNLSALESSFTKFKGLMGAVGLGVSFAGIVSGIEKVISVTAEAQKIQGRLDAVLRSTGASADYSSEQISNLADSIAASTRFTDEAAKEALTTLLTFPNITRAAFGDAAKRAADLAAVMNTDLRTAAQKIGQVLNDPVNALDALSKSGIRFTDAQQTMIEKMIRFGDVAGAQKLILGELQNRIGGAAEGENTGLFRATNDLSKSWDELLETFGKTPGFQGTVTTSLGGITMALNAMNEVMKESDARFLDRIGVKRLSAPRLDDAFGKQIDKDALGASMRESGLPEVLIKSNRELEAANRLMAELAGKTKELKTSEIFGPDRDKELNNYYNFLAQKKEATEKHLAEIQVKLLDERGAEQFHYQEKLAILQSAEEQKIATLVSYDTLRENLKKSHEEKITEIEDREFAKRNKGQKVYRKLDAESAGFFLGQVSNLMQSNNKKQFEIGKKAAIANTLINTYQMATSAYAALAKIPFVGPVLGAAAAAAAVLFGNAQVQNIRSQQFEGGGGGGASPTFSASPNTGEPTGTPGGGFDPSFGLSSGQEQGGITVIINGTVVGTREWIDKELIPGIRDGVQNRDITLIPRNSRNALDLAVA